MPEDLPNIDHDDILRFEETLQICAIMAELGVKTIRVTGGEPLVRKGWLDFIKNLKEIDGIENITLTTNALLLGEYLEELAALGLAGLNISLDSLDAGIYKQITGFDAFHDVFSAINRALELGLRTKINCVPMSGINDSQILPIAALAETLPLDVRFIELMPTGAAGLLKGIPTDEIYEIIRGKYPSLANDDSWHGFGPAKYFKGSGMMGSIGFISAISEIFCANCNRVRLSSDGQLILCLHQNQGLDLRKMLRGGASSQEIKEAVIDCIKIKPEKHSLHEKAGFRQMSKIGG
jgi:cyclic pyranopterin phosphate synthase